MQESNALQAIQLGKQKYQIVRYSMLNDSLAVT